MKFDHSVLATACAACLGACAGMPDTPDLRSGTVADVYVETAPGLFVERRLAARSSRASVAIVSLVEDLADDRATATAWVAPGTVLARGDFVRLKLGRARGQAPDAAVPATDRVLGVVPAAGNAIAASKINDR